MKSWIGRILSLKSAENSCFVIDNGINTVIKIAAIIIPLKTVIRCLNFNENTPIIKDKQFLTAYYENIRCFNYGYFFIIIEERQYCVNNTILE